MAHIIGIGGPSRSGKSSLALEMKNRLSNRKVLLLDMDDFVFSEDKIPRIKGRADWECPESVNFERMIRIMKESKDSDFIVVEGILIFTNKELRKLLDTTIQIEISKQTFLQRRRQETRWGNEPDWYLEHVWESYLKHGQYKNADLVISGEKPFIKEDLATVLEAI